MIKIGLALVLALTAAKSDPQNEARKAFNNCMVEVHNKAMEAKSSPSEFNKVAQDACMPERTTYHDIIAKGERGFGSSAKEADQYANEEVQSIVDSITSAFGQNSEKGSTMVPEK